MITYKIIEYQTLPTLVRKIRELVKKTLAHQFQPYLI